MTEDAVFLIPGKPAMRKSEFAAAAKAQATGDAPTFDGASEIQEVQVFGDWAFMWSRCRLPQLRSYAVGRSLSP
jgi:hypothetical protein